jgi:hypothetical protein
MPWAKQTIIINGESVEAMAKVSSNGTGTIELPYDNEDKYKLDQKVSIGSKDYAVRLVASRHEETTILDIIEIQDIKPIKKKKEKKIDVEY